VSATRLRWTCRTAILLAIVGVFGTWRVAGPVSLDGFEGPHNGWFVVVFALLALAGVNALVRRSWLGIVDVAGCGAIMVSITVQNLVDDGDVLGGHAGWGIWLTLAASVVVLAAAGVAVAGRLPRGSTPASPRPSP
jgi:hypothetical protein